MTNEMQWSIHNNHVGVNLRVHNIIMMDASWYRTSSKLLSVQHSRQKAAYWWNQAVSKSCIYSMLSSLFWSAIIKTCYQLSHHVVISWNVDFHWLDSHRDGVGVSLSRLKTFQVSLPGSQEVTWIFHWICKMPKTTTEIGGREKKSGNWRRPQNRSFHRISLCWWSSHFIGQPSQFIQVFVGWQIGRGMWNAQIHVGNYPNVYGSLMFCWQRSLL